MDCMKNRFQAGVLLDGRFETLHELNHGSFGMVFKARDVIDNKLVALKCLTKPQPNAPGPVDDGREELAIHTRIGSHPNIVDLVHHFETENHIYLVLEFCSNGDLFEAIHAERGPKQTEKVREMMLQLIDAVEFMHSRGVYHRDIKPENIFLSESGAVKLGDFGLATLEESSIEPAVGSDRYMAPEQYDPPCNGYSPAKADIWAVGICLLNILFGKNPFNTPTENDRCYSDFVRDRSTLFDVFDKMAQDTFNVLTHCLVVDPEARSLSAAREAVKNVDIFTTDDESMDEFLMNSPPKEVTANREPLRTPSISSPQLEHSGAFPWPKALALTTPVIRQLSAIPDEELREGIFQYDDHYPSVMVPKTSAQTPLPEPPASAHTDNASIVSFVDSGLGMSLKSSTVSLENTKYGRSQPLPISAPMSMPTRGGSLAAIFGKKKPFESKSWSDMIEDDDDDFEFDFEPISYSEPENDNKKMTFVESVGLLGFTTDGSDTPRAGAVDVKNTSLLSTAMKSDEHIPEPSLFDFEQHPDAGVMPSTRTDKPSTAKRLFDKWQALGDRRRAYPTTAPVSAPVAPMPELSDESSVLLAQQVPNSQAFSSWNRRYRVGNWRKPRDWSVWGQGHQQNNSSVTDHATNFKEHSKITSGPSPTLKEWSLSTDWRKH